LFDDNLASEFQYDGATAELPNGGFWLKWDFSAIGAIAVDGWKQGGSPDAQRKWLDGFQMQFSHKGTNWTTIKTVTGLTDPGNSTLGALVTIQP
jgi:hypothetical protein